MSPGTEVCHGDKDLTKSHPIIKEWMLLWYQEQWTVKIIAKMNQI